MKTLLIPFALLLLTALPLHAQQAYKIGEKSTTQVKGTSTMHDWESVVEGISGTAQITCENGAVQQIQSLNATFKAKSIKSGKGRMDNITYDAIKADKHPTITFELTNFKPAAAGKSIATGNLSIAGVKKEVSIEGSTKMEADKVLINGEYTLKLTDYGIEPPTAMLGAIKVGNEITIAFQLELHHQ